MSCRRCGGLQLRVRFESGDDAAPAWQYDGWRCMNCGEIVDPIILQNRERQGQPLETHRARPYEGKVVWARQRDDAAA